MALELYTKTNPPVVVFTVHWPHRGFSPGNPQPLPPRPRRELAAGFALLPGPLALRTMMIRVVLGYGHHRLVGGVVAAAMISSLVMM